MNPVEYSQSQRLLRQALELGTSDDEIHRQYERAHDRLDRYDKLRSDYPVVRESRWLDRLTNAAAEDISHWETVLYHRRMLDAEEEQRR